MRFFFKLIFVFLADKVLLGMSNLAVREPFLTILKNYVFSFGNGKNAYQAGLVCKAWFTQFNALIQENRFWRGFCLSQENTKRFRDENLLVESAIMASHCSNGYFEDMTNYNFHIGKFTGKEEEERMMTVAAVVAVPRFPIMSICV